MAAFFAPLFPAPFAPSPVPRREDAKPTAAMPCIAVFTDLSTHGARAAWRGALVARDHGLPLRLVACAPFAARALPTPRQSLERLAREIRQRLQLAVSCVEATAPRAKETLEALAADAALIVIAPGQPRPLLDRLVGTRAEQWLRRVGRPVLVVQRPALASYRRAMTCVDLAPGSHLLVEATRRLARDPRMTVFHALCTRHEEIMHLADVPASRIRASYESAAEQARAAIERVVLKTGATLDDVLPLVERGAAAECILERERSTDADLLVLGLRRLGRWTAWTCGVARRVLLAARSDVLLLPLPAPPQWPAPQPASRTLRAEDAR